MVAGLNFHCCWWNSYVSENPWSPPGVQEDAGRSPSLWRLFFGWIATGLSVMFSLIFGGLLATGEFAALPFAIGIFLSTALWFVGRNLRLNPPKP
jgi:hypothetical protein